MNKKCQYILNLNFCSVLIWLMFFNLVFSSYSSAQRSLIKIKCLNDTYLIKACETAVKISLKDIDGASRDFIDSVDEYGIYFKRHGKIEYDAIISLEFKPYWKSVRIINAVYFSSMLNLFPLAIYESYTGLRGSGIGVIIWFVSIPIWAGIIPGAYNLILHEYKPVISLNKMNMNNFEMIEERY